MGMDNRVGIENKSVNLFSPPINEPKGNFTLTKWLQSSSRITLTCGNAKDTLKKSGNEYGNREDILALPSIKLYEIKFHYIKKFGIENWADHMVWLKITTLSS